MGEIRFLIPFNKRNKKFFYHFCLLTAKLCNWLISFLLKRRDSPGEVLIDPKFQSSYETIYLPKVH